MKNLNTYLTFDGNCKEAMTFYKECLGAELQVMPFSAMPTEACGELAPGTEDRTMHACLTKGPVTLMASDTMPGMPLLQGNNFSININCESQDEIEKLFAGLGDKGNVTMPLQEVFWAARFGMLTDKFGINWMFNLDKA